MKTVKWFVFVYLKDRGILRQRIFHPLAHSANAPAAGVRTHLGPHGRALSTAPRTQQQEAGSEAGAGCELALRHGCKLLKQRLHLQSCNTYPEQLSLRTHILWMVSVPATAQALLYPINELQLRVGRSLFILRS